MTNPAIAIPRAMRWLVEPLHRRFGVPYAEIVRRYPNPTESECSAYVQILQFWIKMSWTILAMTFGFLWLIVVLGTRFALGYDWFLRHGRDVSAPLLLLFLFSVAMLLVEYTRESYWRWSPAKPYDAVFAAAMSLPLVVLSFG